MIQDMIREKRMQFIREFGSPPQIMLLTPPVLQALREELERAKLFTFTPTRCETKETGKLKYDGMRIMENTARPDIRICFKHLETEQVFY